MNVYRFEADSRLGKLGARDYVGNVHDGMRRLLSETDEARVRLILHFKSRQYEMNSQRYYPDGFLSNVKITSFRAYQRDIEWGHKLPKEHESLYPIGRIPVGISDLLSGLTKEISDHMEHIQLSCGVYVDEITGVELEISHYESKPLAPIERRHITRLKE